MHLETLNQNTLQTLSCVKMAEPPAKCCRTQLSFMQKQEIVNYKSNHASTEQEEIALNFSKLWILTFFIFLMCVYLELYMNNALFHIFKGFTVLSLMYMNMLKTY